MAARESPPPRIVSILSSLNPTLSTATTATNPSIHPSIQPVLASWRTAAQHFVSLSLFGVFFWFEIKSSAYSYMTQLDRGTDIMLAV